MDCQVLQGLGVTLEQGDHLVLRGQGDLQDLQVSIEENCTIIGLVYPHELHCSRMMQSSLLKHESADISLVTGEK